MQVSNNYFQISKHLVSLPLKFNKIRQVEPPSPIGNNLSIMADQTSDDPLSSNVYMIMGDTSGESQEGFAVCAWSARTGLSYIGTPSPVIS